MLPGTLQASLTFWALCGASRWRRARRLLAAASLLRDPAPAARLALARVDERVACVSRPSRLLHFFRCESMGQHFWLVGAKPSLDDVAGYIFVHQGQDMRRSFAACSWLKPVGLSSRALPLRCARAPLRLSHVGAPPASSAGPGRDGTSSRSPRLGMRRSAAPIGHPLGTKRPEAPHWRGPAGQPRCWSRR